MDRGAYRSYLFNQLKATEEDTDHKVENDEKAMQKSLNCLVVDGRISAETADSVLKEFRNALNKQKKAHKNGKQAEGIVQGGRL